MKNHLRMDNFSGDLLRLQNISFDMEFKITNVYLRLNH